MAAHLLAGNGTVVGDGLIPIIGQSTHLRHEALVFNQMGTLQQGQPRVFLGESLGPPRPSDVEPGDRAGRSQKCCILHNIRRQSPGNDRPYPNYRQQDMRGLANNPGAKFDLAERLRKPSDKFQGIVAIGHGRENYA
jgi:hypothetical protein